ncbi:MAG: peptide deformylase [Verrucomicrobia bacterium]|nr:peptide deformylase [Verrucomicrobiota bacterium]MBU4291684.1 peptide deformylase [Verrucomicrobiota bacterium]MBU4430312.1 peptide deformylase [Verrucomicrobiota bacterium]MCG2680413.1 peptide deformylase [Kiritimatiellia bacterium]
MKYQFCIYGHPVLRQPADPVALIDKAIRILARDMLEIMGEKKGVGLAAQQIGQTVQICTIGFDPKYDAAEPGGARLNPEVELPLVMINPVILSRTGAKTDTEGCLSVPEIWAPVHRAWEVSVKFLNLKGELQTLQARGLLARVIQHEQDHLNGVLFVDRVSAVKKISLSGKLKRMKKKTEAELGLG